jgi:dTMP kinase
MRDREVYSRPWTMPAREWRIDVECNRKHFLDSSATGRRLTSSMTAGLFISLDGMDGAGKSTQCRLLADWLRAQGRVVVVCHDPGGTDLGQRLRDILLNYRGAMALSAEALLFMASRAQLVGDVIQPALADGQVVICDRFLLANVVYQGHAGGLDTAQLWSVGLFATGGLEPDFTFVLDLPVETAFARRRESADRMESRGPEYFARVRAGFLAEVRRRPECLAVIDGSAAVDIVQAQLRAGVAQLLITKP